MIAIPRIYCILRKLFLTYNTVISARRVMSKWKVVDASTIEGIEVVYDAGGGDPLAGPAKLTEQNKIISKSRLRLQRM